MDLDKQIVDIWVDKLVQDNPTWFEGEKNEDSKRSKAFELLSLSAYLNQEPETCLEYLFGQGHDMGIDGLWVGEVLDNSFQVILVQSHYKRNLETDSHFPANKVLRSVEAVRRIFNPRADYDAHPELKAVIEEIRSLIVEGNLPDVTFILANNGLKWNQEGQNHIDEFKKSGDTQNQVRFRHLNHTDIVSQVRPASKTHDTLQLTGAALNDKLDYSEVIIGKVSVLEIFRLIETHGDHVLEKNIRRFLGLRNSVNESIRATLLNPEENRNFFFFNNGITIVCTRFSYNGLQDKDWKVRLEHMQVINGGQTCKTIHETLRNLPEEEKKRLRLDQVFAMVRLYEIGEEGIDSLVTDITRATNSQSPVDLRDLRANDTIQRQLEIQVTELGYHYKRKRDTALNTDPKTITNSAAAEAVMAIWRKKPHVARFQQTQLFSKYYEEIFNGLNGAQLILATLIYRYCDNRRRGLQRSGTIPHIAYSRYYLAMLTGDSLLKKLNLPIQNLNHKTFENTRSFFEENKESLYQEALDRLGEMLRQYFGAQDWQQLSFQKLSAVFRRADLIGCMAP
jgi:hypothetical protein